MKPAAFSTELEFHDVAGVFPLMHGADFDALVADIREHGLREPIWLHRDGRIIDGRNRYRACIEAGVDPKTQTYIGPQEGLLGFVISMNLRRRHLNESQRAMVAAKLANLRDGQRADRIGGSIDLPTAAEILNVSEPSVKRARVVQDYGTPELIDDCEQGEIAVSDAAAVVNESDDVQHELLDAVRSEEKGTPKNLKAAKRKYEIAAQRAAIAVGTAKIPEGLFEVIAIDPPWPYGTADQYDSEGFRGGTPYPEMSLDELAALELPAAKDCVLWLWTTHRFMRHAFYLLDAWGFEEKVILTWVKDRMGTGRWLRSQSEFVILAVRGKPQVDLTNQTTVLHAPMRQHSRKPDEFYEMVESLCIGRRLDFFSRERRDGWEQMGNDPDRFEGAA